MHKFVDFAKLLAVAAMIALLCYLGVTVSTASAGYYDTYPRTMYTICNAKVYKSYSNRSKILRKYGEETKVKVLGYSKGYYIVSLGGNKKGYVEVYRLGDVLYK